MGNLCGFKGTKIKYHVDLGDELLKLNGDLGKKGIHFYAETEGEKCLDLGLSFEESETKKNKEELEKLKI